MTGPDGSAAPEFTASRAFVLEPVPEGTRLVERFRASVAGGPAPWLLQPMLGFGVFLMTRKQMLGIRARAERVGAEMPLPDPVLTPA